MGGGADLRWIAGGVVRFLLVPLLLLSGPALVILAFGLHGDTSFYDFRGGLWNAGVAILHGHSPYWPHFLARQAAIMRGGGIALGETYQRPFSVPLYPAPANVAVVPLSLLPIATAGWVFDGLLLGAMLGGLWLLGVRDARCLAVACVSEPFLFGIYLGAVGPLLVLGAGIAWRWRARLWPPALAVAGLVALKLFPWTLGGWLLVTRRWRALAIAVGVCVVVTLGCWAAIGFHGLAQYPQMLSEMSFIQVGRAASVATILVFCGVPASAASGVVIALAVGLLALAARVARSGPDGDRRAFSLAILAALTGTPIVWEHYMVLLFVPIALMSPRLSRLWLVPVATPLVAMLTQLVVPLSSRLEADPPDTLRTAIPWLLVQAMLVVSLATTGAQRAAWWARARRLGRPRAAAAVAS